MAAFSCSCCKIYRTATREKSRTSCVTLNKAMGFRDVEVEDAAAADEDAVTAGIAEES